MKKPAKAPDPEPPNLAKYPWILVTDLDPWVERVIAKKGVADVARSPRGFLTAYRLAQGQPHLMGSDPYSGEPWILRRIKVLDRLVAAMAADKFAGGWDDKGQPTRRHLALMAWAYTPTPRRFQAWLALQRQLEWKAKKSPRGRKRLRPRTIRLDELRVMVECDPPTPQQRATGLVFHFDNLAQRWYQVFIQPGKVKKSRE